MDRLLNREEALPLRCELVLDTARSFTAKQPHAKPLAGQEQVRCRFMTQMSHDVTQAFDAAMSESQKVWLLPSRLRRPGGSHLPGLPRWSAQLGDAVSEYGVASGCSNT